MRERAHARHDRRVVVRLLQARGDRTPSGAVGSIELCLDDHRRVLAEGVDLELHQDQQRYRHQWRQPAQKPDPRADHRGPAENQRHFVADAEWMSRDECVEGERDCRQQRKGHQQAGGSPPHDADNRQQQARDNRGSDETIACEAGPALADRFPDRDRLAEEFRIWHIEAAGHEPLAGGREAHAQEEDHRRDRVGRDARGLMNHRHPRQPVAPLEIRGGGNRGAGDRPRFVARQARGDDGPAGNRARGWRVGFRPLDQPHDHHRRECEEQRLGHGRALEVEHVGIEGEQGRGQDRAGARSGQRPHDRRQAGDGDRERHDRDSDRKRAGAVEPVDLDRNCVDDVRQRQPHRADLLPARRDAVEDAPGHHEVGLGVVVAEREPCTPIPARRECAQNGGENAKDTRKSVEGGHCLVL